MRFFCTWWVGLSACVRRAVRLAVRSARSVVQHRELGYPRAERSLPLSLTSGRVRSSASAGSGCLSLAQPFVRWVHLGACGRGRCWRGLGPWYALQHREACLSALHGLVDAELAHLVPFGPAFFWWRVCPFSRAGALGGSSLRVRGGESCARAARRRSGVIRGCAERGSTMSSTNSMPTGHPHPRSGGAELNGPGRVRSRRVRSGYPRSSSRAGTLGACGRPSSLGGSTLSTVFRCTVCGSAYARRFPARSAARRGTRFRLPSRSARSSLGRGGGFLILAVAACPCGSAFPRRVAFVSALAVAT